MLGLGGLGGLALGGGKLGLGVLLGAEGRGLVGGSGALRGLRGLQSLLQLLHLGIGLGERLVGCIHLGLGGVHGRLVAGVKDAHDLVVVRHEGGVVLVVGVGLLTVGRLIAREEDLINVAVQALGGVGVGAAEVLGVRVDDGEVVARLAGALLIVVLLHVVPAVIGVAITPGEVLQPVEV